MPVITKYLAIENPWPGDSNSKARRNSVAFFNLLGAWVSHMIKRASAVEMVLHRNTRHEVIVKLAKKVDIEEIIGAHYWRKFCILDKRSTAVSYVFEYDLARFGKPEMHQWTENYVSPYTGDIQNIMLVNEYPTSSYVSLVGRDVADLVRKPPQRKAHTPTPPPSPSPPPPVNLFTPYETPAHITFTTAGDDEPDERLDAMIKEEHIEDGMKIASKIDPYEEEAALQALKSEPVETAVFSKVKQEPGIKEEPIDYLHQAEKEARLNEASRIYEESTSRSNADQEIDDHTLTLQQAVVADANAIQQNGYRLRVAPMASVTPEMRDAITQLQSVDLQSRQVSRQPTWSPGIPDAQQPILIKKECQRSATIDPRKRAGRHVTPSTAPPITVKSEAQDIRIGSMSTARTPSDRGRPELTTQRYSHGAQIKQEPVEEAWNPAFASTPANLQRYINTRSAVKPEPVEAELPLQASFIPGTTVKSEPTEESILPARYANEATLPRPAPTGFLSEDGRPSATEPGLVKTRDPRLAHREAMAKRSDREPDVGNSSVKRLRR
ncbi:unnamed protein product [Somion occarium]|uniref:Uncharacterized protein n=1 Tax=Somion occarium TaxID=3059160 RepID=A0ABP1D190_9APHY